jgi:hypothetical protein
MAHPVTCLLIIVKFCPSETFLIKTFDFTLFIARMARAHVPVMGSWAITMTLDNLVVIENFPRILFGGSVFF